MYQGLVQPSSEKLPPAAEQNKHGDPESAIRPSMRYPGTLSTKCHVSNRSFPLRSPAGEEVQRVKKARGDRRHWGNAAFWIQHGQWTHELTGTEATHTGPAPSAGDPRDRVLEQKGGVTSSYPYPRSCFQQEMKICCLQGSLTVEANNS